MANRNWNNTGRRPNNMNRSIYDRPSPWQNTGSNGQGPLGGSGGHLGSHPEALSLASNLLANILQQRNVPSLLDLPMRQEYDNFNRNFGDRRPPIGRMGSRTNQGPNFNNRRFAPPVKRTGTQNFQFGNKNKPFKKNNQGNKPSDSKAAETAEGDKTEEGKTETNGEGASPKKSNLKTPYDGILGEFLHCHVCDKRMWDGRSFQNHINGRAHSLMMEKNKDSYALRADALRQELKLTEMKKDRHEKKDYYCAMCDIYAADAGKHRISPSHRRLKRYLHPACNSCHKQHATRIDFDAHRLTPQHLKVIQNTQKDFVKNILPKSEPIIIYTKEQELVHVKIPRHMNKKYNKPNEKATDATTDKVEGEEVKIEPAAEGEVVAEGTTAEKVVVKVEEVEVKIEQEPEIAPEEEKEPINYITDYEEGNDLTGVTEQQIPDYSIEVGFGKNFIGDYHCKQCTLCNKILDTEETAEVHTRTLKHFRKFTNLVREKAGLVMRKEQQKRTLQQVDDEDSKRRKLDDEGNPIKEEVLEAAGDSQEQGEEAVDEEALLNEEDLLNEDNTNEEQLQNGEQAKETDTSAVQTVEAETVVEPVEAVSEPPVEEVKVAETSPVKKQPAGRQRGRSSRGRRY